MRMPLTGVVPRTVSTPPGPVVNIAHRGASAYAPENTLAAIRKAIGRDADLVELDVQRTRDGALVLVHDTTLTRTTNVQRVFPHRGPWLVGDFTYAEIQQLDAGSWKSSDYAGEKIPTLTEAIAALRPSRVGLLLELKAPALYPGIVPEVVAALQATPGYVEAATAAERLVVESFDHEAINDHKTLEPSVPVGLLGNPPRTELDGLATWVHQVNPRHWSVDTSYVAAVQQAGMSCHVWTVNHVTAMRRALRMGVDGVITDRPDVLQRLVNGHQRGAAAEAASGRTSAPRTRWTDDTVR